MRRILKKSIALAVAAVILAACVPFSGFIGIDNSLLPVAQAETAVYTEGVFTYEIDGNGDAVITKCDQSVSGEVEIPSSIKGHTVTSIENHAFQNCYHITKVTMPDSITFIGEGAFRNCSSLTEVYISKNVISLEHGVFEDCHSLKSVNLPKRLTSIGDYVFGWCYNLESIDLPDGLKSIGHDAFVDCDSLTSVEIPASVSYMGNCVFRSCDALVEIVVAKANKSYMSDEYGVLFNKDKTVLLQYPVGNTRTSYDIPYGVLEIGEYAFDNVYILIDLTIPESVVTVRNYAFIDCDGIKLLPDSIETIGYDAFYGCSGIKNIPANVVTINNSAFAYCDGIENIVIPECTEYIGYSAFYSCQSLESITVDEANENYSSDENGVLFNKDKTTLIQYPSGSARTTYEIPESVVTLEQYSFAESGNLTSMDIPDNVRELKYGAFRGCWNLDDVTVSDNIEVLEEEVFQSTGYYNNEDSWENGVLYIDSILYDAYRDVDFGEFEVKDSTVYIANGVFNKSLTLTQIFIPESVKVIFDNAFNNCEKLEKVNIAENSNLKKIGNYAFRQCLTLNKIRIPDGATYIGEQAFYGCVNLKNITVADTVEHIGYGAFHETGIYANDNNWENGVLYIDNILYASDKEVVTGEYTVKDSTVHIANQALYDCENLTKINVPASVKFIGSNAFNDCYYLENVDFAQNSQLKKIGDYAFGNCHNLHMTDLPSGVTEIGRYAFGWCYNYLAISSLPENLQIIGERAFWECNGMETVTIPASVTEIGTAAFACCYNLRSITVDADNPNYISDENGVLFTKDKSVLLSYPVASSLSSYTIPVAIEKIDIHAFYNAYQLTEILFAEDGSLKEIGDHAFDGCWDTSGELNIPGTVKKIGYYAFNGCGYSGIHIPGSVNNIGDSAFKSNSQLTKITVDESNKNYCADENGVLFNKNKTDLIIYPQENPLTVYDVPDSVTVISNYAFEDCDFLEDVTLPDSLVSIEYGVFNSCEKLESVVFGENSKLTTIESDAFSYCGSLEEIYIPASVRYISASSFRDNYKMKDINVAENNGHFMDENGVLFSKDMKTIYYYPEGKTEASYTAPYGLRNILYHAFRNNQNLVEINLPDTITSISSNAFNYNGYYRDESNWENGVLYVGKYLVDVKDYQLPADYKIKDGTRLIAHDTFNYCDNLKTLEIPDSVLYIQSDFYDCDNFTDIYYEGSPSEWQDIINRDYIYEIEDVEIHYGRSDDKAIVEDEKTDISIEYYEDIYEGEVGISVVKVDMAANNKPFDIISGELKVSRNLLYDIKMTVDGVEVQPTGKVTVRMPLPDGYNPSITFVYHVDMENEVAEKMNATVEVIDGKSYLVFDTTHFSYYSIVEKVPDVFFNESCPYCGLIFNDEEKYDYHVSRCDGNFDENCPNCGENFKSKSEYNAHIETCMPGPVFEKYCLDCGLRFTDKTEYDAHVASHSKTVNVVVNSGHVLSGEFKSGATIVVRAEPVNGKIFSHWFVEGATVADANSPETTIVLGSGEITITAEYDDCECKCHQGGLVGFFYKIILFFQKLFGNNLVCFCGEKH